MDGTDFSEHYIVIGWNELSRIVIKEMLAAGFKVAALTREEKDIAEMRAIFSDRNRFFVTVGFFQDDESYMRLNIARAAGAILISGDDTTTLVTVLELKQLNPALKITAYIQNSQLKRTVENAGVSYVISPNEIVGRMIASATFEPDVGSLVEDLLSTTTADNDFDIQEYHLMAGHELVGHKMSEATKALLDKTGAKLLSLSRRIDGRWRVMKSVPASEQLCADDHLLVLADQHAAKQLAHYLGVVQGRVI